MDKIFVTLTGLLGIAVVYWFFFGKKDEVKEAGDALTILVDGGYKPNLIRLKQGKSVTLTLIRKDPNTCLEEINFPDYKIKVYLPLNQPVTINLPPPHPKTGSFYCGMNMFHGRFKTI